MAGAVGSAALNAQNSASPAKAQAAPARMGFRAPSLSRIWPESGAITAPTAQPGSKIEPASVAPAPITSCE